MKKQLLNLCLALLVSSVAFAQAPDAFKYQAVVRDASSNILANQNVNFRMSIYKNATTGIIVYSETHLITTNSYGLANLTIGSGTLVSGDFSTIDWSNDLYFIKTEVDPTGGSTFTEMGISQLQSVPYALSAKTVTGMALEDLTDVDPGGATANQVLSFDGIQWIASTLSSGTTYSAGSGISITGTTIANTAPDQTVSLSGSGATSVSGSYPNFTISSTDNNTTYSAGTGLSLSGNSFNANNTSALWNASQLQGNAVSSTSPLTNQVMSWSGTAWVPTTMSSPWTISGSNIYRNSGFVGVGTTTPVHEIHAMGSSGTTIQAEISGNASVNSAFAGFSTSTNSSGENQGIYARAINSTTSNVGGIFIANGSGSGVTNYGVYAVGNSGSTSYAGYFNGNLSYTGSLNSVSDQRLKTNITPYTGALDNLMNLSIYRYDYEASGEYASLNLAEEKQYGFLAQDLEQLFPDLVHENKVPAQRVMNEEGNLELVGGGAEYKSVNQLGMIPILIQAMQEQQDIITDQQQLIQDLNELTKALDQRIKSLENNQ